jgi:hypothetical protein
MDLDPRGSERPRARIRARQAGHLVARAEKLLNDGCQ